MTKIKSLIFLIIASLSLKNYSQSNNVAELKYALQQLDTIAKSEEEPNIAQIAFAERYIEKLRGASAAIMNITIAELYQNYLNNNGYLINGNAPIADTTVNIDIKYWDRDTFKRKINYYQNKSLDDTKHGIDKEILQKTKTDLFSDIFKAEKPNYNLEPTIYDYLIHKLIHSNYDKNKSLALYDELISFDASKGHYEAAVFNEIEKIKYKYNDIDYNKKGDEYFDIFETLKNKYSTNDFINEITALQMEIRMNQERPAEAVELYEWAVKNLPKNTDLTRCKSVYQIITTPSASIRTQNAAPSGQAIPAALTYKNIDKFSYKIYKVSFGELQAFSDKQKEIVLDYLKNKKSYIEKEIDIPNEKDFKEHSSLVALPKLTSGAYFLTISAQGTYRNLTETDVQAFQVSNLCYISENQSDKAIAYTLDRETGKRLKNVKISSFSKEYNYKTQSYEIKKVNDTSSDKDGLFTINSKQGRIFLSLSLDGDTLLSDTYFYGYNAENKKFNETTKFLTDRAIYRPGQTVFFKGIITRSNSEVTEIATDKDTKVTFRDANGQNIETKEFNTDDFGGFDGSFVIPTDLMNGTYSIKNESGSVYFKVEEYKRPTFEIRFDEPKGIFTLNEDVTISGDVKAYSGFGIGNAKYTYRVERTTMWWFVRNRFIPNFNSSQIAAGEGVTDTDGHFALTFNMKPDSTTKPEQQPRFRYKIFVEATNAQGETQTSSYEISGSYNKVFINTDLLDNSLVAYSKIQDSKYKIQIQSSLNKAATISRKFYSVKENDRFSSDFGVFDRKLMSDEEMKAAFPNFDYYNKTDDLEENLKKATLIHEDLLSIENEALLFQNAQKVLKPGRYIVELKSTEDSLAVYRQSFIVINEKSGKAPAKEMLLTYIDNEQVKPGETVAFVFGSAAEKAQVTVNVKHGNDTRFSKTFTLNNECNYLKYNVKEEDRGGLTFEAIIVRHNTCRIEKKTVNVSFDNYRLDVKLSAERDASFLPGNTEQWNVQVTDNHGQPVVASLIAGMYDASLDVFAKNEWAFNAIPRVRQPNIFRIDNSFNTIGSSIRSDFIYYPPKEYYLPSYESLIPNVFPMFEIAAKGARLTNAIDAKYIANDEMAEEAATQDFEVAEEIENEEPKPVKSLRENFNETAFFYPRLTTGDDGSASFTFTVPDALTRWNFMTLAYTKDLKTGQLAETFTTSKPLMIMADMPRFCYENDTLWMTANIVNLSVENIEKCTATLQIFNVVTEEQADIILSDNNLTINNLQVGQSQVAKWKVGFKKGMSLLKFRFSVSTENFEDAEQHMMPVLSNEVFVTQTTPITVKANSQSKTKIDGKVETLTVNITTNPVWLAIQSLPYLAENEDVYVETSFYRFYANSLASHIAQSIPNLLNYIEKWKAETPEALLSNLEKDENLKAIMLKETPWVLEAKNESEQKARIAELLNVKNINKNLNHNIKFIKEKQKVGGGWPWIEGMPESEMITTYILTGLGRLEKMNATATLGKSCKNDIQRITEKASAFVKASLIKHYDEIVKKEKTDKYQISSLIISELYALSYFNAKDSNTKFNEARDFYLSKMKKQWKDFSFPMQAKIALILNRNNDVEQAKLIVKTLGRYAQKKDDIGMYWVSNKLIFNAKTSDHVQIMEAFAEIGFDKETMEQMRLWLLSQKRTNCWENTRSTADAIYAILMNGDSYLNDNQHVTISLGNIDFGIDMENTFIQRSWSGNEITPDMNALNIDNPTNHPVYGGVFRQFFVPIDEVQSSQSPLSITREIYVEKINETGTYLVPLGKANPKVGDKVVVNITFESSQDMEFVFVKDLRASCLEPTEQVSHYQYNDGIGYYQSTTDSFMGFYIDYLPKGKHRVTHSMFITKEGSFSNGYALVQCLYAPEFSAYSNGMRMTVK